MRKVPGSKKTFNGRSYTLHATTKTKQAADEFSAWLRGGKKKKFLTKTVKTGSGYQIYRYKIDRRKSSDKKL